MPDYLLFETGFSDKGKRADVVVSERSTGVSRSLVQRLFRLGKVRVAGSPVKPSHRMRGGEMVEVEVDLPPSLSAAPEELELCVVYEDDDLAVIDKPPGLAVHPSAGHARGTLANALVARYPGARGVGERLRPGIVHRLDMNTSGLLVVALTASAHADLQHQIRARTVQREYLALVAGHIHPTSGVIDAAIGRDPAHRKRMAVHGLAARSARTEYAVVDKVAGFSLVHLRLQTGRTHQIRVHLAAIGHPLAGDALYGGPSPPGLNRQFLHACRLRFRSPSSNRQLDFRSFLAPDLVAALDWLHAHDSPMP